jgi:hypothetical protein
MKERLMGKSDGQEEDEAGRSSLGRAGKIGHSRCKK